MQYVVSVESLYFYIVILVISHFGFEVGTLVLIASVPGHSRVFFHMDIRWLVYRFSTFLPFETVRSMYEY